MSVRLRLAERETLLGRQKLRVREVRKLAEGGRQISLVSAHPGGEGRRLAALLFARWSQENYFRYMRQHYGLDALSSTGPNRSLLRHSRQAGLAEAARGSASETRPL